MRQPRRIASRMTRPMTRMGSWAGFMAAASFAGSVAFGAPPARKTAKGSPPAAASTQPGGKAGEAGGGGILAGPAVEPRAQDRSRPAFPGAENTRREPDVPLQQWMRVLRSLDLTIEQRDMLKATEAEFTKSQRDYLESQPAEVREIMRKAREARENGEPPPPEARETLRKFEEGRPKAQEYQQQIWDQLTAEQQGQMKAKLDEIKARRAQERKADGPRDGDRPNDPPKTRRPGAPDGPGAAGASGNDVMQGGDGMQMAGDSEKSAAGGSKEPAATRPGDRRGGKGRKLDAIGRRRLEFLQSRQTGNHLDGQPRPEERTFTFPEDNDGDDNQ